MCLAPPEVDCRMFLVANTLPLLITSSINGSNVSCWRAGYESFFSFAFQ